MFIYLYKQHLYMKIMSSIFRKIEEPKCSFCQRSLAVSEQGRVAFSEDNGSLTALVVIFDQELLLQLLTVTFNCQFVLFNWKLIDKTHMVKTLFKCFKQGHFYQRLPINRATAEYDNKLQQNRVVLHSRTLYLNELKKTHKRFYFPKFFFVFFKIIILNIVWLKELFLCCN